MIVVVHEAKSGKLEDASVFGPFETDQEAWAFIEWAKLDPNPGDPEWRIPCDGRDMVKVVQPIKVRKGFDFEYSDDELGF